MSEDKNKGKSAKEQNNTTNPFERKKSQKEEHLNSILCGFMPF